MATTTGTAPDDQRWLELARVIEDLSRQVHALADTRGRSSMRVGGLEKTTCKIQEAVAGLAQWQGTGANHCGEREESNPLVGKHVVPEGLTSTTTFKQWSRRYKLLAGAQDERTRVPVNCPGSIDCAVFHLYDEFAVGREEALSWIRPSSRPR